MVTLWQKVQLTKQVANCRAELKEAEKGKHRGGEMHPRCEPGHVTEGTNLSPATGGQKGRLYWHPAVQ